MVQVPLCRHFEFRRIDFAKRERDITELFNELALRCPERADEVVVVTTQHCIDRWLYMREQISRSSKDAVRHQYPLRFGVKSVQIEPVQCLGDHDEINCRGFETTLFRCRDTILHALVWLCIRN